MVADWPGTVTGKIYRRAYVGGAWSKWREGYDTLNVIGTVSNDLDGDPDGAVIERGSNPNGKYVRFPLVAICTAPAAFTGTITKIDSDKLWIGTWT